RRIISKCMSARMARNYQKENIQTLTNNTGITWRPIPKLTLRGDLALSLSNQRNDKFIDPMSGTQTGVSNVNLEGKLNILRAENYYMNTNLSANYVNNFGGHNMNFAAGLNIQETRYTQVNEYYAGFPSGFLSSPNYATAMERKSTYTGDKTRLIGTFTRINYTYRDIYLVDLSGRIDGNSAFGTEKRFAPFWSVGGGINFHNYDFLKNNSIFSRIRLTGNIGQLGKSNFSPFAARGTYVVDPSKYSTGTGVLLRAMENPKLTWEITKTKDLILDLGLFKNRLSINVNWYDKLTEDLVNDVDMPLSSGFPTFKDNVGKIRNRGIEFRMQWEVVRKKDFFFSVNVNMASNKNTLVELSNSLKRYNELVNKQFADFTDARAVLQDEGLKKQYSTAYTKYVEGASTSAIYGMRSLGINPSDGKELYMRPDGTVTYTWAAADQVVIGDITPKGQGGFGFYAMYKGISLSSTCMFQFGAMDYNYTLVDKIENVDLYNSNADRRVLEQRWRQPGDFTPLKDIADRLYITRPTSRFIQKNNYIQIQAIALGYEVPQQKLARLGLSRLKIQLNSGKPAIISSIRQERGINYPFARTYELSINAIL
ncbi:MAG: TonB-dependent receptor, partial [Chitinophagaceae bacterium]|nr:TonB-dependent receptor [Chitinophagaceae bacterium]